MILGKCDEFFFQKEIKISLVSHKKYIVLVCWRSVTSSISQTLSSPVEDR